MFFKNLKPEKVSGCFSGSEVIRFINIISGSVAIKARFLCSLEVYLLVEIKEFKAVFSRAAKQAIA